MSSFLTNCNRTQIESRHISGKAKLNPLSDVQSRCPPECKSEFCSIHKFINEAVDSVVDEGAKNCNITNKSSGFTNRNSWKSAQESNNACTTAKQLLSSGKPPPKAMGKTSGEYWNDIRHYCRDASISKDGLLVVKIKPSDLSGNIERERIVVPKPLVPALLYHMHNHNDDHPVRTQQKSLFLRQFYAIGLDKHLDLLYQNCYHCSVVQKLPKEVIQSESKTEVDGPQTHFHADVIKRAQQNILVVKDHFSSFQDALLIHSESALDLCEGIIILSSGIRRPSEIFISVDNSPGFKSLLNNTNEDLRRLKISLIKTDELNKNANAVVDKGCQELEIEIKQLVPEGTKLTNSILKQAILNLNSKLRRRGNISAFEINTSRDQNTGENLSLNDEALRTNQMNKRKEMHKKVTTNNEVEIGDTVKVKNQADKHKASDIFIVTSKQNEQVGIQKLLHPLEKTPLKFMGKVYQTKQKLLHTIHRPVHPNNEAEDDKINLRTQVNQKEIKRKWNPINAQFFKDDDEEDDDQSDTSETETNAEEIPDDNAHNDLDSSQTSNDLQWDNSPEQYELDDAHNPDLTHAIQPRELFPADDSPANDDLTSEDSKDDTVFNRDSFETPPTEPRLKRSNAIRTKNRLQVDDDTDSEPRVTRQMLSNPTSPFNLRLNERQVLENVLNPNAPLVPELVELGPRVQNLAQALEGVENDASRRSSRRIAKVDYLKFHNEGKRE